MNIATYPARAIVVALNTTWKSERFGLNQIETFLRMGGKGGGRPGTKRGNKPQNALVYNAVEVATLTALVPWLNVLREANGSVDATSALRRTWYSVVSHAFAQLQNHPNGDSWLVIPRHGSLSAEPLDAIRTSYPGPSEPGGVVLNLRRIHEVVTITLDVIDRFRSKGSPVPLTARLAAAVGQAQEHADG